MVAAVWFGYDAPRPIAPAASGGRLAAPAWAAFYLDGWRERNRPRTGRPPAGMVSRTIDAFNGDLANEWCPVTQREWFRAGTEPTRICREHTAPFIDRLEEFGRKLGKALKDLLRFWRIAEDRGGGIQQQLAPHLRVRRRITLRRIAVQFGVFTLSTQPL